MVDSISLSPRKEDERTHVSGKVREMVNVLVGDGVHCCLFEFEPFITTI